MSAKELIEVKLELFPPATNQLAFSPSAIASWITVRACEIVADLGLPLEPKVLLRKHGVTSDCGGTNQWKLMIDGVPCRQEMDVYPQDFNNGSEDMPNWVSTIMHANRERLLTPAVLSRIHDEYGLRTVALLPEMVGRGISLGRVVRLAAGSSRARMGSERYELELTLGSCFPPYTTVEVGPELYALFMNVGGSVQDTAQMLGLLRDGLFYDIGVQFPAFQFVYAEKLGDREFRVRVGDLRGPVQRTLHKDEFLVNNTREGLNHLKLESRNARNPASGLPAAIVTGIEAAESCRDANLTTWDCCSYVVLMLSWILRSQAHHYLTAAEVQRTLSRLSDAFPLSIVDFLERFSPVYVLHVLRLLVAEDSSIRNFRSIIEAMMEINGRTPAVHTNSIITAPPLARFVTGGVDGEPIDAAECADYVRRTLKRYLTSKYAVFGVLNVIETTTSTEDCFLDCAMPLDRQTHMALIQAVGLALAKPDGLYPVVILTSAAARRDLRQSLAIEFPRTPVLSREEIDDSVSIKRWKSISLG